MTIESMLPAVTPHITVGRPSAANALGVAPVGLRDDADAKALRLEQAADQRHPEAGVIDVGVAGDQDDVAAVPAELVHLGARHGQHRRDAEALGPVLTTREEGGRHQLG